MSEIIFDNQAVNQAIDAMTQDISAPEVYIIGIHRGGAEVADTLQQRLKNQGMTVLRGNLD
ncbi:MAG: bifunctional pyr operon transcriptional regulator/uracil phosphoribosyltransferase PyrR, partial [Mariprofundus sp.]